MLSHNTRLGSANLLSYPFVGAMLVPRYWLLVLALSVLLTVLPGAYTVFAQTGAKDTPAAAQRVLILENIELVGTERTPLSTVLKYLPLELSQEIDQQSLIDGVAVLGESNLFKQVSYYTKPGSQRGHLILVLEVEEHGVDFRFGTGNTDLDGWYIIPAMVAMDNHFGQGGLFDLQWRVGFRHSGLQLNYLQPSSGDGRSFWGGKIYSLQTNRPYFDNGVEYRHGYNTAGISGVYGQQFHEQFTGEVGLRVEYIDVARNSSAISHDPETDSDNIDIPYDDLLPQIQQGVGDRVREVIHFDLRHDSRNKGRRAGTPTSGLWGRLKTSYALQGHSSHVRLNGDLRSYKEVPGGVLASRMQAALVSEKAEFYDRLYLGGMYTVRGFPTHSLSSPGGDTWLWSGSLEYRSQIIGQGNNTKLAGLFYLDAGAAGGFGEDDFSGISVGAGYGLRWKVRWLGWLGLDIGLPLTKRPVDSRFQANASIGWSF